MGSTMTDKTEAQPEALRVAAWLINAPFKTTHGDMLVGGRELRRLYAETEAQAARIAELEAQPSARQAAPDERAAFERWAKESAIRIDLGAWDAWQARAMISAAPPPPEREPLSETEVRGLLESAGYWPGEAKQRAHFINGLRHGEMAHGIGATND